MDNRWVRCPGYPVGTCLTLIRPGVRLCTYCERTMARAA